MSEENTATMSLIKRVSKEARYKIVVEIMLSTRSIVELARVLGISPTAVRKYIERISYPSDEILARAITQAAQYEKDKIIEVLIDDVIEGVMSLYSIVDDNKREVLREKLRSIIGS